MRRRRIRNKKQERCTYGSDGFYRQVKRQELRNKSAFQWAQLIPLYYDYVDAGDIVNYILNKWGIRVTLREAEDICFWLPCDPNGDCM